jgi:hypothetical protein
MAMGMEMEMEVTPVVKKEQHKVTHNEKALSCG